MCILAWHWQPDTDVPFYLISNRDEFTSRPTLPLHWWANHPILAGQDMQEGGTWLGINKNGILAALTNYRSLSNDLSYLSRGEIIKDFLSNNLSPETFLQTLKISSFKYKPFNLLLFDKEKLFGFESLNNNIIEFDPGYGVVSNGNFDSSWPKCHFLLSQLKDDFQIKNNYQLAFSLLKNNQIYQDNLLPSTGINLDLERILSSVFIQSPIYGTRSSSIIKYQNSSVFFIEKTHGHIEKTYFYKFF